MPTSKTRRPKPPAPKQQVAPARTWTNRQRWLLLIALFAVIAVARLHSYDEPLERDLAIYSIIGQEMLKGRALYGDLWDIKPPGLYLAYAIAHAVTPSARVAVYLLAVSMAFVTMLGIVRLTERFERKWIWVWAALCWVVVSGAHSLQANQPNTEVFMNAGVVWFLVICTSDPANLPSALTGRWRRWLEAAMLAVTSLFKHVVVILGVSVGVADLATAKKEERAAVWKRWALIAAFGAVFWIVIFLIFAVLGTFDDFYGAVFEFTSEYSGSLYENLKTSFAYDHLWPGFARFLWPLVALAAVGLVLGIRKPATRRFGAILLALCLSTYVEVAMPGKFFPHYFQLWLPVLVICGGWGLATIGSEKLSRAVGIVAFLLLVRSELPSYSLPAEQWSMNKYGDEFVLDQKMGRDLRKILRPGETFYHWGNQPSLYFETGVSPPSGVFFGLMLWSPLVGQKLGDRILEDIKAKQPDLYVESISWAYPPWCQPIQQYRQANYKKLDDQARYGKFVLYARAGSALAQRHSLAH